MSARLGWILFGLGLGTTVLGIGVVAHNRRKLGALGRGADVRRLGPPTPVVEQTTAGGMTVEHRRSRVMPIEERVRNIQDLIWKSIKDPRVIRLARLVTYNAPERNGEAEAKAIYDAVKARIRYTGDIAPVRMPDGTVEAIDLYQSALRTWEFKGGDCLPAGTLLLTERHELVPIEKLVIGQRIWGRDSWTEVKDVWSKGVLPVDVVFLNNGSSFKATPDHKVYVLRCETHPHPQRCDCDERLVERITIEQLSINDVLLQPKVCPLQGNEVVDEDHVMWQLHDRERAYPSRVTKIERAVVALATYDLQTADHYVYLPEADVVVSNCDDHAILNASLLTINGIQCWLRVTATSKGDDWSHIYVVAGLPKLAPSKRIAIDTTLPGNTRFAYEVPFGKYLDFPV